MGLQKKSTKHKNSLGTKQFIVKDCAQTPAIDYKGIDWTWLGGVDGCVRQYDSERFNLEM